MKKLLVVGAGAVGSYIGAFLSRAGHDVTFVDPWAEQVEAINARGIAVSGPHDPFTARPRAVHLHEAARLAADFDMAIVTMKSYDTAWAAQLAVRHLGPQGFVVSAQNCWNDPLIASIAGADRAVGLVMSKIGVALWKPGEVERGAERGSASGHDVFRAGEHDGRVTPRTKALAEMLGVVDGAKATDNLWGERWSKLCSNAMGNPVQGMSGLGTAEVMATPSGRAVTIHLAAESARVGLALGYRVPKIGAFPAETWAAADRPETYAELDTKVTPALGPGRNWRSSMAQDVIKRRRTEIDYMNGFVVARAREAGVRTPVSEVVVDIVRGIDAGTREPGPATIDEALRRAGVQ
ncbi:MAG: 2-dehydropantoate 2-reductase [Candidatus Rokuibacteriota bacterium]|nr:MAG: 2-dehydropantoate 2-reductase [Candidatus Rokubacteria bacterium]